MDCLECGETFFGTNKDFCSIKCFEKHTAKLKSASDDSNTEQKEGDS